MAKRNKRYGLLQIFVGKNAKASAFWAQQSKKGKNINISLSIIICKRKPQEAELGSGGK
uniref:Uncharacterized protein n=1 Tax=Setaria italica TaxID=4555 RepID=K3Z258_SETIT